VQAVKAVVSSWQRKVTPVCVSLKLKLALVWFVGLAGDAVMVGAGGGAAPVDGNTPTTAVCHPMAES
jgi:hypothetical protein